MAVLNSKRDDYNVNSNIEINNRKVLDYIKTVALNGHNAGIPITICGEMATCTDYYEEYIKMGITGISISDSSYLSVWNKLSGI